LIVADILVIILSAVQSSTIDRFTADLALDGKATTCSLTGVQVGAWWKIDLHDVVTVKGILITGEPDMNACVTVEILAL
jgi:hypothetical protein